MVSTIRGNLCGRKEEHILKDVLGMTWQLVNVSLTAWVKSYQGFIRKSCSNTLTFVGVFPRPSFFSAMPESKLNFQSLCSIVVHQHPLASLQSAMPRPSLYSRVFRICRFKGRKWGTDKRPLLQWNCFLVFNNFLNFKAFWEVFTIIWPKHFRKNWIMFSLWVHIAHLRSFMS